MHYRKILCTALLGCLFVTAGCQSVYYDTMEKFGVHKRDILVDRVADAKKAQEDAKKQFASALDQFIAVTHFQGGELEAKYDQLKKDYERSEAKAAEVRGKIDSIDDVANALFNEWRKELGEYTNQTLRAESEKELQTTQARYEKLIKVMRAAAAKMDPVLAAFKDEVLFLKHNLNAQALASLDATSADLQQQIKKLIDQMEASIAEADAFIKTMKTSK